MCGPCCHAADAPARPHACVDDCPAHPQSWKVIAPYRIRCLYTDGGTEIKIGLQLYRVRRRWSERATRCARADPRCARQQVQNGIYLLDLQKIKGDAFSFMNLCAQIILELKVPSSSASVSRIPGGGGPSAGEQEAMRRHGHTPTSSTSSLPIRSPPMGPTGARGYAGAAPRTYTAAPVHIPHTPPAPPGR